MNDLCSFMNLHDHYRGDYFYMHNERFNLRIKKKKIITTSKIVRGLMK